MVNKKNIVIFTFFFIFFNTITFADVKTDIYSEVKCFCCKKKVIDCVCKHVKEIKSYIEALLDVGLDKNEVLLKVAKKYSLDSIIDKGKRKKIERRLKKEAGDKRPEIFIQPLSYNLGKRSKSKGEMVLVVELQNKGNDTLIINNLKTSCECSKVQLKTKDTLSRAFGKKGAKSDWKADIPPKEKAKLIIVTDPNHKNVRLGHMHRTVEIKSNDPVHSLVRVEFEAEIVE